MLVNVLGPVEKFVEDFPHLAAILGTVVGLVVLPLNMVLRMPHTIRASVEHGRCIEQDKSAGATCKV